MDSDEEFFASSATISFLLKENWLNCNRNEKGEFNHLYYGLRSRSIWFYNCALMSISTFDYILNKNSSRLTENCPNFVKDPILPCQKLIITCLIIIIIQNNYVIINNIINNKH